MAKVVVKSNAKKSKRKFPVEIVAPEVFNNVKIGASQVTDLNGFVGRTIKLNLMYVSGSVKSQNIWITFRVTEVSSGLAKTEVKSYEQIPYFLGRFVKKGSDLMEDSVVFESKDSKKIRFKPFIVTKENVSGLVHSALRAKTREVLKKEVSGSSYDEVVSAVISGKLQNLIRNEIKKIFPLKAVEFKKVDLI